MKQSSVLVIGVRDKVALFHRQVVRVTGPRKTKMSACPGRTCSSESTKVSSETLTNQGGLATEIQKVWLIKTAANQKPLPFTFQLFLFPTCGLPRGGMLSPGPSANQISLPHSNSPSRFIPAQGFIYMWEEPKWPVARMSKNL